MKDDEYKGYYCLLIAILCNLNAAEASTMYEYGPDHPLCRKILKKKVRKPSIKKLKESEMAAAMKALLDQPGCSIGSISVFSIYGQAQSKKINRKEGNE